MNFFLMNTRRTPGGLLPAERIPRKAEVVHGEAGPMVAAVAAVAAVAETGERKLRKPIRRRKCRNGPRKPSFSIARF